VFRITTREVAHLSSLVLAEVTSHKLYTAISLFSTSICERYRPQEAVRRHRKCRWPLAAISLSHSQQRTGVRFPCQVTPYSGDASVMSSERLLFPGVLFVHIIINIKLWTLWSVSSPELQLLSPTFLWSSNCSPSLWSVVIWFQRDSV